MIVLSETERCNVIKSNGRFVDEMKIRHPFQSAPYLRGNICSYCQLSIE